MKKKTLFFCNECGYESGKWIGQCPACKSVGTFVEAPATKSSTVKSARNVFDVKAVSINEVKIDTKKRISTGFSELDRVLGSGVVEGALMLIGGDPGIGKSTILLQVCRHIAESGKKVLYISGEESLAQIKIRAMRIGDFSDNLKLLSETSLDVIESVIEKEKPDCAVIDSIQTIFREDISSAPGSVSQVRESTNSLMQIAKGMGISIFIVGHVTKEGAVAGPRVLEHMVDTVLYFEGDRHASYRIIRGVKNRFGSTDEIGVFEMREEGLVEVPNPSEFMLEGRPMDASGSVITCLMEGTRPILVEIQALATHTNFGMARRTAVGVDYNRVNLLMAVIEKRLGIQMSDYDAYVNVAGGMKVSEPAMDLALVSALISSYKNCAIDSNTIIFGEVGLSGEIRAVSQTKQRILEAKKLGFNRCIVPHSNKLNLDNLDGIEIVGVKSLTELVDVI